MPISFEHLQRGAGGSVRSTHSDATDKLTLQVISKNVAFCEFMVSTTQTRGWFLHLLI
jgi:hypothetical protein